MPRFPPRGIGSARIPDRFASEPFIFSAHFLRTSRRSTRETRNYAARLANDGSAYLLVTGPSFVLAMSWQASRVLPPAAMFAVKHAGRVATCSLRTMSRSRESGDIVRPPFEWLTEFPAANIKAIIFRHFSDGHSVHLWAPACVAQVGIVSPIPTKRRLVIRTDRRWGVFPCKSPGVVRFPPVVFLSDLQPLLT